MSDDSKRDSGPRDPVSQQPSSRPTSATSMTINWAGFAVTVCTWWFCMRGGVPLFWTAILTMATYIVAIATLEWALLRTPYRITTGLNWSIRRPTDFMRVLTKTVGFYATIGSMGLAYWVVAQYHGANFNNFFEAVKIFVPCVCLLQIPYFLIVDKFSEQPEDAYWMIGRWVLRQSVDIDSLMVKQHFLGWIVKGFFLPMMFSDYINLLGATNFAATNFIGFFDWAYNAVYTVDLMIVTVGYICTLKLLDSHIRSTEPTMLGWCVALICYPPFWGSIYSNVLPYDPSFSWGPWLRHGDINPVTIFGVALGTNWPTILWGSAILLCSYIYSWSSLVFGLRFSNLTHRGTLTNGPYRFTKHPAYVFKNISWWLIAVPFVAHTGIENSVRECLMLLTVNFIYFMRARTEERHLSHDPAYVEYALYMNRRSIFAPLAVVLPFLKYRKPRAIPGFSLKV